MKILGTILLLISLKAHAGVKDCHDFSFTINLKTYARTYYIQTFRSKFKIVKRKALLQWESGHESKKWRISEDDGFYRISIKDLEKVFESYRPSTSPAAYIILQRFVEDHKGEKDFRFPPMNESAPFFGDSSYQSPNGEIRMRYSYANCSQPVL